MGKKERSEGGERRDEVRVGKESGERVGMRGRSESGKKEWGVRKSGK